MHSLQPLFLVFGAPDLHSSHVGKPKPNDTFAPGHILQDDDVDDPSFGLNLPGAQSLHVEFESAPIAVENLPILQLTQVNIDIAPILLLYFPASHESQPDEIL